MPAPDDLAALRATLAARLAARLADAEAPLSELRELQERLKLLDLALAEQGARAGRRLGALLWPLLLVGGVLLLAATVPVRSVPLSLSLKASALSLELAQATSLGPLNLDGELRAEGFAALESADPALVGAAAGASVEQLSLRAGELRLRALQLPAGTRLALQAQRAATGLEIESPRAPVIAELELRGPTLLRLGDADAVPARDYAQGEWLRLLAGDAAQPGRAPPPLSLALPRAATEPLRLSGLRPVSLRFTERRDAGAGSVGQASSLQGGSLNLPATGQALALAAGEMLEIDGLVVERFELIAGAPLQLELTGSARGLRLRVGEFERSLKPSWLEYVSRHHLAQLLWGSAALLWGALAWLRRQFAGAGS